MALSRENYRIALDALRYRSGVLDAPVEDITTTFVEYEIDELCCLDNQLHAAMREMTVGDSDRLANDLRILKLCSLLEREVLTGRTV